MPRPHAHALILGTGHAAAMICEPCNLRQEYPRTEPAQEAARQHNHDRHTDPGETDR